MLIQFAVENYRSFSKKAVLSMVAAPVGGGAGSLYVDAGGGLRLMRCAALYGANASGKSNLIKALAFAKQLITQGTRPGEFIPVSPFRLDADQLLQPGRFEFEFLLDGHRYSYGFLIGVDTVWNEWLMRVGGAGDEPLFEREALTEGKSKFDFGDALVTDPARKPFLGFIGEATRPNQLFLAEAKERNVTELNGISNWFQDQLKIILPESQAPNLALNASSDPELRRFLSDFLRTAGTGVAQIDVRRYDITDPSSADLIRVLGGGRLHFEKGQFQFPSSATHLSFDAATKKSEILRLVTQHASSTGPIEFELDDESDGTQRLLHLAPTLYPLSSKGARSTTAVDELERSLHPLLTRLFLQTFLDTGTAENAHSQLIFTTHDTNLLDLQLLGRDALWFVEKDTAGGSHLYSLAEFKPAQLDKLGDKLESGYLQGRFGAIPFFGDFAKLGWAARKPGGHEG